MGLPPLAASDLAAAPAGAGRAGAARAGRPGAGHRGAGARSCCSASWRCWSWMRRSTAPPDRLVVRRLVADRLSLGAENAVVLALLNRGPRPLSLRLRDEHPVEFRASETFLAGTAAPGEELRLRYTLTPPRRGDYRFGRVGRPLPERARPLRPPARLPAPARRARLPEPARPPALRAAGPARAGAWRPAPASPGASGPAPSWSACASTSRTTSSGGSTGRRPPAEASRSATSTRPSAARTWWCCSTPAG